MGKDKRKPLVELESYNGKVKAFWESGKEAAEFYGFSQVLLSICVKGRSRHVRKKYFRYATDEEIAAYYTVKQKVTEEEKKQNEQPATLPQLPTTPVETIPEKVEKPAEELSPFEKLLKKGKEKLI